MQETSHGKAIGCLIVTLKAIPGTGVIEYHSKSEVKCSASSPFNVSRVLPTVHIKVIFKIDALQVHGLT